MTNATTKTSPAAPKKVVVQTIEHGDPEQAALAISAVMAVDLGVQSEIRPYRRTGRDVVADDGKTIRIIRRRRK